MENLAKAIIAVMKTVKGIEKGMTVGAGQSSYKGVSDKDVKNIIGKAMEANGLCVLPIEVAPVLRVDRWEETVFDNYQKKEVIKQKQQVFTEVTTKYLLLHESGESQVISGYGHGVDAQDKGAGKATTYALKNAMLYTFFVPTGEIDDTDVTHSDNIEVAPVAIKEPTTAQKVASMQKPASGVTEKDLVGIKDSLKLLNTEAELATFWKNLTGDMKTEAVIAAFASRKSDLLQPA